MTPPGDAHFVDALSGSDGTSEIAPLPWYDEQFGDPLAASPIEPKRSSVPVVSLPVVEFAPPDPREWMSHLAAQEPRPASQRPDAAAQRVAPQQARPAPAQYPPAQYPPAQYPPPRYQGAPGVPSSRPGSWAPPAAPGMRAPGTGQRYAARQSSAPPRRSAAQRFTAAQQSLAASQAVTVQRRAPAGRQTQQPGVIRAAGRRKSGGGWVTLFALIVFLVFSGVGRDAINALLEILNR